MKKIIKSIADLFRPLSREERNEAGIVTAAEYQKQKENNGELYQALKSLIIDLEGGWPTLEPLQRAKQALKNSEKSTK